MLTGAKLLLALCIAALSCGGQLSGDDTTDASTDASKLDARHDGALHLDSGHTDVEVDDGNDGACNTLTNGGPAVDLTEKSGLAPDPVGGEIEPGLYYLTAYNDYNGSTGTVALGSHATLSIEGNTMDSLVLADTFTDTFTTSGTTLMFQELCPLTMSFSEGYTATTILLIFYETDAQGNVTEAIYTKQ